jgi:ATP-dependent exoDNAse (exonuclease V) alpha subunit
MEGLRDRWRRECLEVDLDPAGADHLVRPPRHVEVSTEKQHSIRTELLCSKGLTEEVSVFERRDAVRGIAERLRDGASLAVIEQLTDSLLADEEVVHLDGCGRAGERLCTTMEMLSIEARLLERGTEMAHLGAIVPEHVVSGVLAERPLMAAEQVEMVRRLTTSGEGLQVVIGKAGAGKTYALDAARAAWQRAGYTVLGTALSARAAAELESGSGIPSCTLASFLGFQNLTGLGRCHVVVLDEAGMVGTRQLELLAAFLTWSRTPLVLVGDHRQLPEIEAGGSLRLLGDKLGAITLNENRRQVEGWEREALDDLRQGEVASAVLSYEDHGRLHLCDSARAARLQMVLAWTEARTEGAECRMYAIARSDVEELNRLARAELRHRGAIGDDVICSDERSFAVGDEVLFCRNDKALGVMNGTRGTVSGEVDGNLVVETEKGTRLVGPGYLEAGHLRHGYASTIHKSQGATVDRAFVLGGDAMYR